MSLRVWLPLTKDLRNQGLDDVIITNSGATFNSTGKLGGCYYFNRSIPNYLKITNPLTTATNGVSIAFWVKLPSNGSVNDQLVHIGNGSGWANNRFTCFVRGSNSTLIFACGDGTNSTQYNCASSALTLNQWTHVVCLYENNKMKIYLNGALNKEYSTTIVPSFTNVTYIGIGAGPNVTEPATVYLNDVRIYDHALSPLEVKHISQGLILHYPLNRNGWGQENLLKNSNDLTLWNKESGVNCEYDLTVKMYKVFSTTRESSRWGIYQDYSVSVDVDTEYTFSLTGKTDGFRSYLSFGAGSSWPTNYTAFDNNKQRLSKTLTIPAGTTNIRVYLAMYPTTGGGYTYFEKPKLEIGNKATPWCPNSSDELATTLGMNNNIEYDCSGFCNNGEYYAYDTNGSISYTSDTPKYNVSTRIASANPTQDAASGTRYLYGHCKLTNPTQMSVAFWLKPITGGYGSTTSNGQGYFCTTNYEYGDTSVGVDYQASAMNHRDGTVNMNDSASTTQCRVTFYPTIGEWHHYVYTYDGQVGRGYKDGVQTATAQFSAAKTLDSFIGVVIGFSRAGGVWRRNDACYSDFRVYATALSAEDIKDLYELGATIDTNGVLSTYEFTEQ